MDRRSLLLSMLGAAASPAFAAGKKDYKQAPIHFIAALGAADATYGSGAQNWGIWYGDPATRSIWLSMYPLIRQMGGFTPANWRIEEDDWWLDENGLIMLPPEFPIPPGRYLVTGDRELTTHLTIEEPDANADMKWSLDEGELYDVTHLPCRASRYTPLGDTGTCLPTGADFGQFPIPVGQPLPQVAACNKKDYSVLIVIGLPDA